MASELGANHLVIHSDSQLVVKQIMGEYEAVNARLAKYYDLAKNLAQNFEYWELV